MKAGFGGTWVQGTRELNICVKKSKINVSDSLSLEFYTDVSNTSIMLFYKFVLTF